MKASKTESALPLKFWVRREQKGEHRKHHHSHRHDHSAQDSSPTYTQSLRDISRARSRSPGASSVTDSDATDLVADLLNEGELLFLLKNMKQVYEGAVTRAAEKEKQLKAEELANEWFLS